MIKTQKWFKRTKTGTIAGTTDLTGAWASLSGPLSCADYNTLTLWLEIDANLSLDIRFRIVLMREYAGSEYSPIIHTVDSDKVRFQARYFEYDVDAANLNIIEKFDIAEANFFKIYVMAGTAGATVGKITNAYYSMSTAVA